MKTREEMMVSDALALVGLIRTASEVAQVLMAGEEPSAEQWSKLAEDFATNDTLLARAEQIRASRIA